MKAHFLCPLAMGSLLVVSMNSCTKTVVQTKIVDSTTVVHDTTGGAWIRFVSMFPPNVTTDFNILDADSNTVFAIASNTCPRDYFPLPPDTSTTLYVTINSLNWKDVVLPITALGTTINTYALFFDIDPVNHDTSLVPTRSIDSEKLTPPPTGKCYVRFIDGIEDATGFYVDLDTLDSSIFRDPSSQPVPIGFAGISAYQLIPIGVHQILLQFNNPNDPHAPVLQTSQLFKENGYYDIQATGWMSSGPVINIYQE